MQEHALPEALDVESMERRKDPEYDQMTPSVLISHSNVER